MRLVTCVESNNADRSELTSWTFVISALTTTDSLTVPSSSFRSPADNLSEDDSDKLFRS